MAGLNLSSVYLQANTILNTYVGKYDKLHLIGITQTTNDHKFVYLLKDIVKGFYFKEPSGGKGDIMEFLYIVPENSTVETALQNAVLFELVNLDGTFTRYEKKTTKPPERPSFQWVFGVKPNDQDKRIIS